MQQDSLNSRPGEKTPLWMNILPWAAAVLVVVLVVFCTILSLAYGIDTASQVNNAGFGLISLTGALIMKKRRHNPVGWALFFAGFFYLLSELLFVYSTLTLIKHPGILPFGRTISWMASFTWMLGYLPAIAAFLLFPNGRPLTKRWWWILIIAAAVIIPSTILSAILLWPFRGVQIIQNNGDIYSIPTIGPVIMRVLSITQPITLLLLLGSVIEMFLRYRRARGIEKQQIKWVLFACALVPISTAFNFPIDPNKSPYVLVFIGQVINVLSTLLFPIAFAFSVMRYRLYEIDVIIRRTLVYSILTLTLAGVYFGSVLVLQSFFVAVSGQTSQVSIILSTLLIATLFTSVRRRVQKVIDRHFYRSQYNAAKMVEQFGALQRESTEIVQLQSNLLGVVEATLQPETVSLLLVKKEDRPQNSP